MKRKANGGSCTPISPMSITGQIREGIISADTLEYSGRKFQAKLISFSFLIRLQDWHIRGMLSSEGLYFSKMLTHGGGAALTGEMQVGVRGTEAWPDLDKTQVLV